MKNFNAFAILLLIAIPFLNSCCKKCQDPSNSDCENYDPCFSEKPVSASFKIFETTDSPPELWKDYETDTIADSAIFIASLEGAEYKWIIGAGTYEGKKLSLEFIGVPDKSNIPVTLIVKKTPNKGCNPNDDGIDTITRNLFIRRTCLVLPEVGKSRGYQGSFTDNPKDTFTMRFFYDTIWEKYNIDPLIRGRKERGLSRGAEGYRQFAFVANNAGTYSTGKAFLKPNDSIEVYFYYRLNAGDPNTYKTFLGKKIY
jgi:hypothetical protein